MCTVFIRPRIVIVARFCEYDTESADFRVEPFHKAPLHR